VVRFSAEEERLWQRVLQRILAEPYRPPRVRDIAKAMGIDEGLVRRLAKMAARRGDVEEIAHDHFFGADVVARMAEIAIEVARAAPKGEFSAAELRDRLDNGRKVAIQVLEFFDRHGFTIRRRDLRRINTHRAAMFATRAGVPTGAKPVATHTDAAAKQAFPAHAAAEPRPIGLQITGALR
jgi:selenocysteine-specific elongation factor